MSCSTRSTARPSADQGPQNLCEPRRLVDVLARSRLVEEQHGRIHCQCTGQFDEPPRAGRHRVSPYVGNVAEVDVVEEPLRHLRDRLELPTATGGAFAAMPAPAELAKTGPSHGRGRTDVLAHRQRAEQFELLEGPPEAEPGATVRREPADVAFVEQDLPSLRFAHPGDHVEQSRLARPVRTDQPGDPSCRRRQGHTGERRNPTEANAHLPDFKRHENLHRPETTSVRRQPWLLVRAGLDLGCRGPSRHPGREPEGAGASPRR